MSKPTFFNVHRCEYCKKRLRTDAGVKLHIQNSPACRARWDAYVKYGQVSENTAQDDTMQVDINADLLAFQDGADAMDMGEVDAGYTGSWKARVDDEPDEDEIARFVQRYPQPVAEILGRGLTTFDRSCLENKASAAGEWAPFSSQEEWELARWLAKNVGQNQIDDFLKLSLIKKCKLSAGSKYTFNQCIDALPTGSPWTCEVITVTGDKTGEEGQLMSERVELWCRDPVDCIRELIGNPDFQHVMAYAPERVYADAQGQSRVYDEMWTGDWWWNTQSSLPPGATVAPVILASDKTKLSQFRGDQAAWPVYLSIGNIAKNIRRQVSARATILVGYLPVSKLECFTDKARSVGGYDLYHKCMTSLLKPLVEAGKKGIAMTCADGLIRRIFPILAAYIADHPEQCLITCVKENRCPRGTVPADERGNPTECTLRNMHSTLETLTRHKQGKTCPRFDIEGLRPVYEPFWASLPHCDIFQCITPDILHQLHKGMFEDHLVQWCTTLVGEEEIDRRFKAMVDAPGLRNFAKGISKISQWTGAEHREMQKVFVTLLSGAVSRKVLAVAQAVVDFIYYAQFHLHTSQTLAGLRSALATFHANKDIFEELGIRQHFNIPKLHAMWHYFLSIQERGTADGYNTELPERLHINYAKDAYRAGNRRDYIAHMTTWLQRQEAVDMREKYSAWLNRQGNNPPTRSCAVDEDSDNENTEAELSTALLAPRIPRSCPKYLIAQKSPLPRTSLVYLQEMHLASEFLPAFTLYVRENLPHIPFAPNSRDRYAVYKQIKLLRPANPYTGEQKGYDRIRAVAASPGHGRVAPKPGHFDTALVIEDPTVFVGGGRKGIDGLRVGRVRVIFELPPQFGTHAHPLAYIEWFTPFNRVDQNTGMHIVSRSTRNHRPNATIVSVDRLHRFCHLAAQCGQAVPLDHTSTNALDIASHFYVNPYYSVDMFSMPGIYCNLSV